MMTKTISKPFAAVTLLIAIFCLTKFSPVQAGFSAIYAFGDGVCTTTGNPNSTGRYYGNRYCNGKVWIETIFQWNGLPYESAKNNSYFGHDSSALQNSVNAFVAPSGVAEAMLIVWCANADFVKYANDGTAWSSSAQTSWNGKIIQSVNNHAAAINTLYAKGVRFIVMPNAANIASIPLYNNRSAAEKSYFRQQVISFNTQLASAMNTLAAGKAGLKIVIPDVFSFFEQVETSPGNYGLQNPIPNNAAIIALSNAWPVAGSPGSDYIFWDYWHPTAKFQMHLASFIQQQVMPVKITGLSFSGNSGQLTVTNIPLGRAGAIEGSATLQPGSWVQDNTINEPSPGGSQAKTFAVPDIGPRRFYRVSFPVVWTWP